jgi:hypothetical protein
VVGVRQVRVFVIWMFCDIWSVGDVVMTPCRHTESSAEICVRAVGIECCCGAFVRGDVILLRGYLVICQKSYIL